MIKYTQFPDFSYSTSSFSPCSNSISWHTALASTIITHNKAVMTKIWKLKASSSKRSCLQALKRNKLIHKTPKKPDKRRQQSLNSRWNSTKKKILRPRKLPSLKQRNKFLPNLKTIQSQKLVLKTLIKSKFKFQKINLRKLKISKTSMIDLSEHLV